MNDSDISSKRKAIALVVVALTVLISAALSYSYFLARQAEASLKSDVPNPAISGASAQKIVDMVSDFKEVPKNETPTVVLVTDISLLTPFGPARPGDAILLYHQSNLAVLFDPISRRIINIVPVNISTSHAK